MEHQNVNVRAVIFDVYGTLLQVGAAPPDADARWNKLFADAFGGPAPLSRTEFSVRTQRVIAHHHSASRALGIQCPEILWQRIVVEVLPNLAALPAEKLDEFIFQQMQIGRSLWLMAHAGECLNQLRKKGQVFGVASNSQHYTLRELGEALQGAGLDMSIFDPQLCFWSFQNGFSKPNPHVFQILTARLEARGISAAETLMVGDRLDNDIDPARAHGWQAWHLSSLQHAAGNAGSWSELLNWSAQ